MAEHTYVFMDVAGVNRVAAKCKEVAEVVSGIITALTAAIWALRATSFLSLGTNEAAIAFLEVLKGVLEDEQDKLNELNKDVRAAAMAWVNQDNNAKLRFNPWG